MSSDAERGASAIEYGLFIAAIAAVLAGVVVALGPVVSHAFDKGCTAVTDSQATACPTTQGSTP